MKRKSYIKTNEIQVPDTRSITKKVEEFVDETFKQFIDIKS
jgi:hypothetical protein